VIFASSNATADVVSHEHAHPIGTYTTQLTALSAGMVITYYVNNAHTGVSVRSYAVLPMDAWAPGRTGWV